MKKFFENKIVKSPEVLILLSVLVIFIIFYTVQKEANKPEGLLHTLKHNSRVIDVTFSPNDKYIATATEGYKYLGLFRIDGVTKVWDVQSGRLIHNFSPDYARRSLVRCVEFSPDSELIASGSSDGYVRIWDADSGKLLHSLFHRSSSSGFIFPLCKINFSKKGHLIATAVGDENIKIWDVETGHLQQTLPHKIQKYPQEALNGVFSNDDKQIITASRALKAKVWDVETGEFLYGMDAPTTQTPGADTYVKLSNNGRFVLMYSCFYSPSVWDLESGQLLHVFKNDLEYLHKIMGNSYAKQDIGTWDANFSHNSNLVVNGGFHNYAQVWDVNSGKLLHTLKHGEIGPLGNCHWVTSAVFSPDDKYILTASADATAKVWETSSGKLIKTFEYGPSERVNSEIALFSNNSNLVLTLSSADTKAIKVWRFIPNY